MKINKKYIILTASFVTSMINGYTVNIFNNSVLDLKPEEVHVHNTASWCPDSRSPALPPQIGRSKDVYSSFQCGGTCFDWFTIRGRKFYIPNQCHDVNIEIQDTTIDGKPDVIVLLNGNTARTYGDWKGFFKDIGNVIADRFVDVGTLLINTGSNGLSWVKNVAEFLGGELESIGRITGAIFTGDQKEFDKQANQMNKLFNDVTLQTVKGIEEFAKNATDVLTNMFTEEVKPNYCDFSYTSKHENMPKTIDDPEVQKQDTEGLIPYIKKYAPIVYIDKKEIYYPIWADEYFTSPTSRIVSKSNNKEYLKGKITFEKMHNLYTQCQETGDLYIGNDECVRYGSNPKFNQDEKGNLIVPVYAKTSETTKNIYIVYLYFFGLNGPYNFFFFKGDVRYKDFSGKYQDLHEADAEHFVVELDKVTKELKRVYFSSHGGNQGFWLKAKDPTISKDSDPAISWEGTHPVLFMSHGSHAFYPKEGTYVRIFGMANDVNVRGQRWLPTNLMRVYLDDDKRFDPKTMGWLYFPGALGAHGVGPAANQGWFNNGGSDEGRNPNADPLFCPNPSNPKLPDFEYENCIKNAVPKAVVPTGASL